MALSLAVKVRLKFYKIYAPIPGSNSVKLLYATHNLFLWVDIDYEDVDELHADCVQEVKKINGAIEYPIVKK